eukprot:TRINITY_DN19539_c0_g1_i1.p1 TRINITY_DN19539_c0_g1~~TRINITY_DN19539_c0_g1_i1.p1  ORF type:complete len:794 (+),score=181.32 TRINITY_DN19539_c0_g1_i1:34-2415(+)
MGGPGSGGRGRSKGGGGKGMQGSGGQRRGGKGGAYKNGGGWDTSRDQHVDKGSGNNVRLAIKATKEGLKYVQEAWKHDYEGRYQVMIRESAGEFFLLGDRPNVEQVWAQLQESTRPGCFKPLGEMEDCTENSVAAKDDAESDEKVKLTLICYTSAWPEIRRIIGDVHNQIGGQGIERTPGRAVSYTLTDRYRFRCGRKVAVAVIQEFRRFTTTHVLDMAVFQNRPQQARLNAGRADNLLRAFVAWQAFVDKRVLAAEECAVLGEAVCTRVLPSLLSQDAIEEKILTATAIQDLIREKYGKAVLYMFGSCVTGLAENSSDLDVACDLYDNKNVKKLLNNEDQIVKDLERHFRRKGNWIGLQGIPRARVPILKNEANPAKRHHALDRRPFREEFDLSFRLYGTVNSYLIRYYFTEPALRVSGVVAKLWSKRVGINNPRYGYLSSYSITLMFIHYAVQKGLVEWADPMSFLTEIQPHPPPLKEFHSTSELHHRVGGIVCGFFQYFALEFDWEHCAVSINRAHATTKLELGWDFDDVEPHVSRANSIQNYHLAIEDPYELREMNECGLNTCRALHRERAAFVKVAFVKAYNEILDGEYNFDSYEAVADQELKPPVGLAFDFNAEGSGDYVSPLPLDLTDDLFRSEDTPMTPMESQPTYTSSDGGVFDGMMSHGNGHGARDGFTSLPSAPPSVAPPYEELFGPGGQFAGRGLLPPGAPEPPQGLPPQEMPGHTHGAVPRPPSPPAYPIPPTPPVVPLTTDAAAGAAARGVQHSDSESDSETSSDSDEIMLEAGRLGTD